MKKQLARLKSKTAIDVMLVRLQKQYSIWATGNQETPSDEGMLIYLTDIIDSRYSDFGKYYRFWAHSMVCRLEDGLGLD